MQLTILAHQVLVQHTEYFDRDNDGVIWPQDTYVGCRDFGWNIILSLCAAMLIHGSLSYLTLPTIIPDPFCRIYLERIHRNAHGSGSMTFDNEGRFRPQMFEDFFAKYDRDRKGGLTKSELWEAWKGQRLAYDFFGWSAAFLECKSAFECLIDRVVRTANQCHHCRASHISPRLAGRWGVAQRRRTLCV